MTDELPIQVGGETRCLEQVKDDENTERVVVVFVSKRQDEPIITLREWVFWWGHEQTNDGARITLDLVQAAKLRAVIDDAIGRARCLRHGGLKLVGVVKKPNGTPPDQPPPVSGDAP